MPNSTNLRPVRLFSDAAPRPPHLRLYTELQTCVATAAPRALCQRALERMGIRDCFDFVTDSYEVGMSKEDPEYFRKVAARLGAPVEECWVFEDAVYAMRGAKAAGMRVCAIEEYTARRHREEVLAIADAFITDYRQPPLFDRSGA